MSDHKVATDEDDPLSKYTLQLARYTKWLMVATVLSMLCTGWIAWSTKELRDFAGQQAKDMNTGLEMTRNAIFAANRQASAAEKANDLANDTARNQLRAYVNEFRVTTDSPFKKEMSSIFFYKNVGQTPALDLKYFGNAQIITSADSGDVIPPRNYATSFEGSASSTVMGGGIEANDLIIRSSPPFKDAEIQDFQSGKKIYIVWGVIYYADVFAKKHYTRFCKYFEKGDLNRWRLCSVHNDSD